MFSSWARKKIVSLNPKQYGLHHKNCHISETTKKVKAPLLVFTHKVTNRDVSYTAHSVASLKDVCLLGANDINPLDANLRG
jgi:hypothetical protein